jgi:hypothetical protein
VRSRPDFSLGVFGLILSFLPCFDIVSLLLDFSVEFLFLFLLELESVLFCGLFLVTRVDLVS